MENDEYRTSGDLGTATMHMFERVTEWPKQPPLSMAIPIDVSQQILNELAIIRKKLQYLIDYSDSKE